VLIRVYVALLAAAWTVYEREDGDAADPWLTLVGYFSSMRELAGMRRLCDDDIRTRLREVDRRGLAPRRIHAGTLAELTSRLRGDQIPDVLERMERPFAAPGEERSGALDILLATNMISVGVDVARLGLMVVAGQPKTTSEYIQATSRVGRSAEGPGLVVCVYNWARPRDLSHFEQFAHYHRTAYQQVEPLTVTPFASRARDRGLAAVLVALTRLSDSSLSSEPGAHAVTGDAPALRAAVDAVVRRAGEVTVDADVAHVVHEELRQDRDAWLAAIMQAQKAGAPLVYGRQGGGKRPLLHSIESGDQGVLPAANSLRDVEPTVGLVLVRDAPAWVGESAS
jgi:hypothetical protein